MSAPEPVVNVDDPTDRGFARVPERVATEQIRLALGCSPGWAQQRVWFADTLANRLPVTRRLLEAGRISGYQALIAAGESQRLTDDRVRDVRAPRLPAWGVPDPGEVPSGVPPRRRRAAPRASGGRARASAKKQTDVTKWVEDAGMASLRLHGPAPVITEIWESVNTEAHAQARAAKKAGEEWVPIGERRVRGVHPVGQDR